MAIKTSLGALRYNNRMEKIWADARRIERERLARGERPNPNLTDSTTEREDGSSTNIDATVTNVMESFELAMQGEHLNPDMIARILDTVSDAVSNNDISLHTETHCHNCGTDTYVCGEGCPTCHWINDEDVA